MHDTPMKYILSHYYFRKSIACAWINPENIVQRNLKFSQKSQLLEEKGNWTCLHLSQYQQGHHTEYEKDESEL